MCFFRTPAPRAREGLIPCDLESDERPWFGRADGDNLTDVPCGSSRTSCDDRTRLIRPTSEVGAELSNHTESRVVTDVEGVGKSVS